MNLKETIKMMGKTQRGLAEESGIKEVTINQWVAGKAIPRLDYAVVAAKHLNITVDKLAEVMNINEIQESDREE
ncbi:helix-turn-helix transcriptional regulator [Spirulina sp. 06S082]|uniref:helix-turn-helix domain-containing protein n=1 Tax=Spirulina sp. 06S082 TaxID=3110248 RepID=UPI002B20E568|nr:helix-turn-helix transcriptional regulator [Spirulina sp. 06S082]MEA5472147.1 helix-turn-helix transcriptional regulator [Spirulina sp. 06S082]